MSPLQAIDCRDEASLVRKTGQKYELAITVNYSAIVILVWRIGALRHIIKSIFPLTELPKTNKTVTDLFRKLNVLVRASINEVLEDAQKAVTAPLQRIPAHRLGAGIEREVSKLREQVNHALDFENELQARVGQIQQEVTSLDAQADAAVANGQEDQARYLLERMTRAQQRMAMTEADLRDHRIAVQELILRVNELDATISEAQHAQAHPTDKVPPAAPAIAPAARPSSATPATPPSAKGNVPPAPTTRLTVQQEPPAAPPTPKPSVAPAPTPPTPKPAAPAQPVVSAKPDPIQAEVNDLVGQTRDFNQATGKMLADALREAQEQVNKMNDLLTASHEVQVAADPLHDEIRQTLSKDAIEEDLSRRRSRLSKPTPPNDPS